MWTSCLSWCRQHIYMYTHTSRLLICKQFTPTVRVSQMYYLLLTSLLSQDHVKINCALWMTKQWVPKRPIQRRKTVCRMAVVSHLTVILLVALVGPLAVVVLALAVVLCALLCRRAWVVVLQHMESSHPFYNSYSTVLPICFVAVRFITFSNGHTAKTKRCIKKNIPVQFLAALLVIWLIWAINLTMYALAQ